MSRKDLSILKNKYYVVLLLCAISLLAYSNSFYTAFHFDDYHQIVKNPHIRHLADAPRFFVDAGMGSSEVGNRVYRPVTFASFAINYATGGYNVFGFHVINFILHLLNALLVYLVAHAVLRRTQADPAPPAFFAALIFVLHPLATGSVTYITGRAVLFASFFCLLGLLSHVRFRAADAISGKFIWGIATFLCLALALLSKEMGVSLLGLIFFYDLFFVAPSRPGPRGLARTFAYYLPVLAALVLYLIIRKSLQGFATVSDSGRNVLMYLVTEARALLLYARLFFLPVNQNADYSIPYATHVDGYAALGALFLAAVLYAAYRTGRRWPEAAFFGLWPILALIPESTLIPRKETVVEYRLYLPLAGFAMFMAVLWAGKLRRREVRLGVASAALMLLLLLTFQRNKVWATEYTLWSDTAKKAPYSARAYANLGQALLEEKRYPEASAALGRALEINPYYSQVSRVYNNFGRSLYDLGRYEEAITQFMHAASLEPSLLEAYENMGAAYYRMGRFKDAVGVLERAVSLDPSYAYARKNLALAYMELGRRGDALTQMREAARCAPDDFGIAMSLALICDSGGLKDEALSEGRRALSLAADDEQRKDAGSLVARISGEAR